MKICGQGINNDEGGRGGGVCDHEWQAGKVKIIFNSVVYHPS